MAKCKHGRTTYNCVDCGSLTGRRGPDGLNNSERGTCVKGHPWIDDNILLCGKERKKKCRICVNSRSQKYALKKRKSEKQPNPYFECGRKTGVLFMHPKTIENTIVWPSRKKECKICYDAEVEKRRLTYRSKHPRMINCVNCNTLLLDRRRKYCSTKCQWRDDVSGFRGRAQFFGVPYETITKQEIFERDKYRCRHCGKLCNRKAESWRDRPTIDHILPMSRGGAHLRSNLQTLCGHCNGKKGASIKREPLLCNEITPKENVCLSTL